MKTRLILVRHAEAEGNFKRIFQGWTDGELTEKGHMQAKLAAERLRDLKIDVIYSSTLKRTMQTAGYISNVKSLPITRTDKLKEINGGDWEGRPWEELPVKWPEQYHTWEHEPHIHQMPNGESVEELQKRIMDEVMHIISHNTGKNICIVTHGTAIKAIMCHFRGCSLEEMVNIPWYDNTAISVIDYEDGEFTVIAEGDASHLEIEQSTLQNQDWWLAENARELRSDSKLTAWLFDTKAVRVSPQDKPFWYTAGTIGPYYINTHFLYGSEEKANRLLELIDKVKDSRLECSGIILSETKENYKSDSVFKGLIDEMVSYISNNISLKDIDYISGGERRDWYFSLIIADILGKAHITIFKDLNAVIFEKGHSSEAGDIHGARVLHIADIITEASSYTRQWIPAITRLGGNLKWGLVVADRLQGGAENLAANNVESHALVRIDKKLFNRAHSLGLIDSEQHRMIMDYIDNPRETMRKFLIEHPEFLRNALDADPRTAGRARICIEKNLYGI